MQEQHQPHQQQQHQHQQQQQHLQQQAHNAPQVITLQQLQSYLPQQIQTVDGQTVQMTSANVPPTTPVKSERLFVAPTQVQPQVLNLQGIPQQFIQVTLSFCTLFY